MSNVLPNSFCIYCSLDSYWAIEAFVSNLSEWYRFRNSSFQSSFRGTTRSVLSGVVAFSQVHQPLNPRNWAIALYVSNRLILEPKYHQVPQLGASHPMVNRKFHLLVFLFRANKCLSLGYEPEIFRLKESLTNDFVTSLLNPSVWMSLHSWPYFLFIRFCPMTYA